MMAAFVVKDDFLRVFNDCVDLIFALTWAKNKDRFVPAHVFLLVDS